VAPIRFDNAVSKELAALHGSDEAAERFRRRDVGLTAPGPGGAIDRRVIVVNDLHMGAGRDRDTGKVHPGDDFTAKQERQFITYLANEWSAAAKGDHTLLDRVRTRLAALAGDMTWKSGDRIDTAPIVQKNGKPYALTLCINGDFLDFLQTSVERPEHPYPDGFATDGARRTRRRTPSSSCTSSAKVTRRSFAPSPRTCAWATSSTSCPATTTGSSTTSTCGAAKWRSRARRSAASPR
jgi:hypothetical protein